MKTPVLALLLVLLQAGGHAEQARAETTDPLRAYWEDQFRRALDHAAVGYAYTIYRHGEAVAVGGQGYARAPSGPDDPGEPMTPDTRIQIASCSKPITAVALLRELERRGLMPEARVWPLLRKVFKKAGREVKQITVEHLLTHTSGYEFGYLNTPLMEHAGELLAQPLPHPPGEKRRYSNINSSLARVVLEVLSGRDYETYIREELLRPASASGMKLKVSADEVAHSYAYHDLSRGKPIDIDFTEEAAAYGWYGTANELARVIRKIRTSSYLSESMTNDMFERELGWGRRELHGSRVYGHDGQWVIEGNVGVRSGVMVAPDEVEAVLLINTNGPFFPHRILTEGLAGAYPRVSHVVDGNTGKAWIYVSVPRNADEVRWTSDGTEPSATSKLVEGPIVIDVPATFKCRGFTNGAPATFVATREVSSGK